MKKSLVALAALVCTGTSFAQVSITGTLQMGYLQTTHNALVGAPATTQQLFANGLQTGYNKNPAGDSSGLGVDTSVINFNASEDFGGGYKAMATLGFDGVTRTGVNGGDTVVNLVTPGGLVSLSSTKTVEFLNVGAATVGAPGWDGRVNNSRGFQDMIAYVLPMGAWTLSVARGDNAQFGATAAGLGLGTGDAGSTAQHNTILGARYKTGAVDAVIQYLAYDNKNTGSDLSINYVTRGKASYDMGSVKGMVGLQQTNFASGMTQLVSVVGLGTSVGAWDFAGNYIINTLNNSTGSIGAAGAALYAGGQALGLAGCSAAAATCGAGALDGTNSGYGLSLTYNLSKSTNFNATYRNWQWTPGTTRDSEVELSLTKNF